MLIALWTSLTPDLITHPLSQFSYWLFLFTCCDHWSTTPLWCIPYTFQITDWKCVEDTTCMKLDSLWWLDAWVGADSNESWTCGRCSGVMWPMNCFGRNRCHLIYITQEIRNYRTGQPINQYVWKPTTHTNCSSLFVVLNYKSIPNVCPFCCFVSLPIGGTCHPTVLRCL